MALPSTQTQGGFQNEEPKKYGPNEGANRTPGKEQQQETKNLFEQIMKENFPNLAKETDFQEAQEAERVPKKLYLRKHTPRHIIITLAKIKGKERILKAAREKETVSYKGLPIKLSADFSKETLQARTD